MLRITYAPDGGDPQQFEFDPENPLNLEAEAVENVGGEAWEDWGLFLLRLGNGNARARRALLWVLLRRTNPQLRFADLVFHFRELVIQDLDDEEPETVGKDSAGDSDTDSPSPTPDSAPSPSN